MLKGVKGYLVEQPNSPNYRRGDTFDDVITVRTYKFRRTYLKAIYNAVKRALADVGEDDDGYLFDWQINPEEAYCQIQLNYSTLPPDGSLPALLKKINTPQYYISTNGNNIPLNQLDTYKTNWNYALSARKGYNLPSWWNTAKDTIIPDADRGNYIWVRDSPQQFEGWDIIQSAQKPGLEEKLNYAVVIREERWCRNIETALRFINRKTVRKTPGQTYGVSGEWLATPSELAPEGNLFHLTTSYLNADEWDPEVYENK